MSDVFKKTKLAQVKFSKFELIHLRDLFSLLTPPEMKETISQKLALLQSRPLIEAKLWQKIAKACEECEIPLGDEAPDFVVSLASTPSIGVYELSHDENQERDDSSIFESSHDDDDDDEEGE
jgi:hypothetical protein